MDSPHLCKFFTGQDVLLPAVARGRVQLRRYVPKLASHSPFQVFNFYLTSGADSEAYVANGRLLQALLTVDNSVSTFVGGDMNFVERVDDSSSSSPHLPTAAFVSSWDAFKTHFFLEEAPHDAHRITTSPVPPPLAIFAYLSP